MSLLVPISFAITQVGLQSFLDNRITVVKIFTIPSNKVSFKNLSLHFNFSLALSSPSLTLPQFLVQCPNTLCASNLFWKAASTLIKSLWLFADLGRSAQMLQNSEKSGPVLLRDGVEVTLFQATDRCLCLSARRRFLSCSSTIWKYNVRMLHTCCFRHDARRLLWQSLLRSETQHELWRSDSISTLMFSGSKHNGSPDLGWCWSEHVWL